MISVLFWWLEGRTYRLILAEGTFLAFQRIATDVQEYCMVIDQQLRLEGEPSAIVKQD